MSGRAGSLAHGLTAITLRVMLAKNVFITLRVMLAKNVFITLRVMLPENHL